MLNTPEAVRPATRERVEVAIRQLGYRRNTAARALVIRRTRLIGVVNPGEARFGTANTTMAIEEAASRAGYATTPTVMRDARASTVDAALDFFLELGVEGIGVIAPVTRVAPAAKELSSTLPVVIPACGRARPSTASRSTGGRRPDGDAVRHRPRPSRHRARRWPERVVQRPVAHRGLA